MSGGDILVVGGYGQVGRRIVELLERSRPGRVVAAGRHPDVARGRATRIDVDDASSVDAALDGVSVVIACVRDRESQVLRGAVRRGIAYTSIAPPQLPWAELEPLRAEARRTGARVVLGTGLEPGISSVLARVAADKLGSVDTIETALLLGVGDAYGADSMSFILDEIRRPYTVVEAGRAREALAFESSAVVEFPAPVGRRRAYSMAFTDQLYYPYTLGAKTALARLALDPPWLGAAIAELMRLGGRAWLGGSSGQARTRRLSEMLRHRYEGDDRFALVVDARASDRVVRATLVGRRQADATAIGASAFVEALDAREVTEPGVWLGEQVIPPTPFLERLATRGIAPVIRELEPQKLRSSRTVCDDAAV
jgi:saccharopine dehydrogenase-like NADP-dependent oxidoreductase